MLTNEVMAKEDGSDACPLHLHKEGPDAWSLHPHCHNRLHNSFLTSYFY